MPVEYDRVIQTLQRFTAEYFSSLDYNPDTTSDLSTHKDIWSFQLNLLSIITPKNFDLKTSVMASPSICSYIHGVVLFLAEKHMKCVFFIFKDNLLTLSHSCNYSQIIIDPILETNALEPLENMLVSSANNPGSVFLHAIQRSFI